METKMSVHAVSLKVHFNGDSYSCYYSTNTVLRVLCTLFPLLSTLKDGEGAADLDSKVKEGQRLVTEVNKMVESSKNEKKIDFTANVVDEGTAKAQQLGDKKSVDEIPENKRGNQYGANAVRKNGGKVQKGGDEKSADDQIHEPRVGAVKRDPRKMDESGDKKKQDVSTVV